MPENYETPSAGAAYLYGFTDGSNHTLDILSVKVDELTPGQGFSTEFYAGFDNAILYVLEIIGQTRK